MPSAHLLPPDQTPELLAMQLLWLLTGSQELQPWLDPQHLQEEGEMTVTQQWVVGEVEGGEVQVGEEGGGEGGEA